MFNQDALSLLCGVFQKSNVSVHLGKGEGLRRAVASGFAFAEQELLPDFQVLEIRPNTLYRATDRFGCHYRYFCLPEAAQSEVLAIGPFLTEEMPESFVLELAEQNGISPENRRYLLEYYRTLPVLGEGSPLLLLLHTFCEQIWRTANYNVRDITESSERVVPFTQTMQNLSAADTVVNMRALERRYTFENEMIHAVEHGQSHFETRFQGAFTTDFLEKRVADPLRNIKNYCIIMNTLLRKAAERGGVHPLHINAVSSSFAVKIEKMAHVSENGALMKEMFQTYCQLVRAHNVKKYSAIVQKAILVVEADISAETTPRKIAEGLGITPAYLSSVFHQETGKTLTAYICEKRMEYAAYLLRTTSLLVHTVALHCGMLDVQYFSKVFKRYYGVTPTAYRTASQKGEPPQTR